MECSVFIESSFAQLKAFAGSEGREEGQLLRPSGAGGVSAIPGHFSEHVHFKQFFLMF